MDQNKLCMAYVFMFPAGEQSMISRESCCTGGCIVVRGRAFARCRMSKEFSTKHPHYFPSLLDRKITNAQEGLSIQPWGSPTLWPAQNDPF